MARGFLLSEEDRATIQRLLEWWRANPARTTRVHHDNFNEDQVGPSVYVARVGDLGMSAISEGLTGTGTGTVTYDDVPAYADCEIYRILETTPPKIIPLGTVRRVYNLTNTPIRHNSWVPVIREGSGAWIAVVPPPVTSLGSGINTTRNDWRYVCQGGVLKAYKTVLTYEQGKLVSVGAEAYSHDEGCCDCPDDPPLTGTGTNDPEKCVPCCSLNGKEILYVRFCSTVCDLVHNHLVALTPSSSNANCSFSWHGNLFVPGNIDITVYCDNGTWGLYVACNTIFPGSSAGVVVSCHPLCIRFNNLYMSDSDHVSAGVGCCKENIGNPPFQNGPMTVYLSDSPSATCVGNCDGSPTTGTGTSTTGGDCEGILIAAGQANCCPGTCWPLTLVATVSGCGGLNGSYPLNALAPTAEWQSNRFTYFLTPSLGIRMYWQFKCVPGSGMRMRLVGDADGHVYYDSTCPTPNCTDTSASGVGSFTGPGSCNGSILTWSVT